MSELEQIVADLKAQLAESYSHYEELADQRAPIDHNRADEVCRHVFRNLGMHCDDIEDLGVLRRRDFEELRVFITHLLMGHDRTSTARAAADLAGVEASVVDPGDRFSI